MLVCDGSAVPANPGVNPSPTITALGEHAIARVPANGAPLELPEAARPADETASLAGAP
jgi:cholesterol oxidase